jgi:MFS family permease
VSVQKQEVEPKKLKLVVAASSAGTVFEWYDFFIFGLLASVMGQHFFAASPPAAQFIFALLTFGVGFAARPLGAVVFGAIGDTRGRKGAYRPSPLGFCQTTIRSAFGHLSC